MTNTSSDNQYALKYGAEQYFDEKEMEGQYEEEGEIISEETIYNSIHQEGSIAYQIILDDKSVGGIIINLKGEKGDLEIFFVNPDVHSHGIGQQAWKEIERLHPQVKIWKTVTPCFEKKIFTSMSTSSVFISSLITMSTAKNLT